MIPDYCEAITAYRAFNVCVNGLLVGQAFSEPWPPYQPFVARCGQLSGNGWKEHVVDGRFVAAPVMGCDCGIHALKSRADAVARVADGSRCKVWGAVKLWGRLIEHEIGYRAEFGYPSALACGSKELAEKVAALYGVPCEVETLPELAPMYGGGYIGVIQSGYYVTAPNVPIMFSSVTVDWSTDSLTPNAPPAPMIAPPVKLGANRWQQRQARIQAGKPQPRKGFRS